MNKLPFSVPTDLKGWLIALLWAMGSGGAGALVEYYFNAPADAVAAPDFWPHAWRTFFMGAVGGLFMYFKTAPGQPVEPKKKDPPKPE